MRCSTVAEGQRAREGEHYPESMIDLWLAHGPWVPVQVAMQLYTERNEARDERDALREKLTNYDAMLAELNMVRSQLAARDEEPSEYAPHDCAVCGLGTYYLYSQDEIRCSGCTNLEHSCSC